MKTISMEYSEYKDDLKNKYEIGVEQGQSNIITELVKISMSDKTTTLSDVICSFGDYIKSKDEVSFAEFFSQSRKI